MTDQASDSSAGNTSTRQRREAAKDTIALVTLCGVFSVLDVLGIAYILVKRPGQQLTVLVTIGGVIVFVLFMALIVFVLTNPIYGPARSAPAARSSRKR